MRPKYRVVVEEATYQADGPNSVLIGKPDVVVAEGQAKTTVPPNNLTVQTLPAAQPIAVTIPSPAVVRQGYLEIREIANDAVVTVLEVLSPVNKRNGKGRSEYLAKRDRVLSSSTHWVEIDLLRQWDPMPVVASALLSSDYRVLVSVSDRRPNADLHAFNIQDPIPVFSLPLAPSDSAPLIDLKGLIEQIYEQSGYDLVIDYRKDPKPRLSPNQLEWLNEWLVSKALR